MKKEIKVIIQIIIFIMFLKLIYNFFSNGHTIEYKKNNISIKEEYQKKNKRHFFEISNKKNKFYFQIYNIKGKKIIRNIKFYKGDKYECVLPIFKHNKILTNIMCKKGNNYYNYTDIMNNDKKLDKLVRKTKEYNVKNYKNKLIKKDKKNSITLYNNIENHYLVMDNYKGIYLIQNNIKSIKIFETDIYKKETRTTINKYYLIADYNNKYDFHKLYLINILNGNKTEIISNNPISLDSYIQGSYKNYVYLYDRSNEKQYKINIENKSIIEIGNKNNKTKYYNLNKFEDVSIYQLKNRDYKFNYYDVTNNFDSRYEKVYKMSNGLYYFIKKEKDNYKIYRSNVNNKTKKIFLFSTETMPKMYMINDYVYYIDGNLLKVYHDRFGVKTILKNKELEFNDNIEIGIYIK